MLLIIDYGMGNLRSVQKAFERIKVNTVISSNPSDINFADKIILPGVGHFKKGMENLRAKNLVEGLNEAVLIKKIPVLGICLGMQLMTSQSEEGEVKGLGWVNAATKRFDLNDKDLKIPHMGWNTINILHANSLFNDCNENNFYYFVHSYYVSTAAEDIILATTHYGESFVSSFNNENIYGVQFHPEKSHKAGLQILSNFIQL